MAKKTSPNRGRPAPAMPSPYEECRDELFQHIMRCGVIGADPGHQLEWFDDTVAYLSDRYSDLEEAQLAELKTLGVRFCQPPKAKTEAERESGAASAA